MIRAMLLVLCFVGLSLSGVVIAQTPKDIQKGETVLAADKAPIDAPLRRHAKSPWYQLSNLRKVSDISPAGDIAVDFNRESGESLWHEIVLNLIIRPRNWLAVEPKTLDAARANPSQFVASVRVLANGTTPIADDLEPILSATPLVKGVPLKAEWGASWRDVTVLEILGDQRVRIHWDGWGSNWDEDRDLASLMVTKETLADLKKPSAKEQFAERLKKMASSFQSAGSSSAAPRRLKDYPIRIGIPATAVRVTDKTPLQEGTKLGCSWGSSWYAVTVLAVHDDGSVRIRWDQYGTAWDGDVSRDSLIIDKKVLQRLEAQARATAKTSSPKKGASDDSKPAPSDIEDKYRVVLTGFGTKKVAVTKVVVDITGLDLKDAKEFVEELPVTLKQGLTKEAADKVKRQLEDVGGTAKVEKQ